MERIRREMRECSEQSQQFLIRQVQEYLADGWVMTSVRINIYAEVLARLFREEAGGTAVRADGRRGTMEYLRYQAW